MSYYDGKRSLSWLQGAGSLALSVGLTLVEVRVDVVSQSNRADGGNARPFPEVEDALGSYSSISALEELDGCPPCQRYRENGQVEYQVGLHLLAARTQLLLFWQNDHRHNTLITSSSHHTALPHRLLSNNHHSSLSIPLLPNHPSISLHFFQSRTPPKPPLFPFPPFFAIKRQEYTGYYFYYICLLKLLFL